jgi:hypothetical protein
MQVTRIYESPRVTLPYTDEQWADVMALGAKVDQELVAGDVRLTMGGEPTFVAVNDRDARRMEHRRPGPDQARPGQRAGAQAARRIRAGRLPALRPGQVVPRRAAAALGAVDLLARRRPADLARPQPVCRRARAACVHRRGFAALHPDAVHASSACPTASSNPATRTPGTTCGASAACRSTWTRSNRSWTTRWSASACAASSPRGWTRWSATCCRCSATRRSAPAWPARCGPPARGSSATSACTCSPVIRRWATACRWIPCPGSARPTIPT